MDATFFLDARAGERVRRLRRNGRTIAQIAVIAGLPKSAVLVELTRAALVSLSLLQPRLKVRFFAAGRPATTHPDEPQFHHEAGQVVDLARVTRSPEVLAAELLGHGAAAPASQATRNLRVRLP